MIIKIIFKMKSYDINKDGFISFPEFIALARKLV